MEHINSACMRSYIGLLSPYSLSLAALSVLSLFSLCPVTTSSRQRSSVAQFRSCIANVWLTARFSVYICVRKKRSGSCQADSTLLSMRHTLVQLAKNTTGRLLVGRSKVSPIQQSSPVVQSTDYRQPQVYILCVSISYTKLHEHVYISLLFLLWYMSALFTNKL